MGMPGVGHVMSSSPLGYKKQAFLEPSLDHQLIFQHSHPTFNKPIRHVSHAPFQSTGFSPHSVVAIVFVVPGVQCLGEQLQPGRGRFDRKQLHDSQGGVYFQATLQQGDAPDGDVVPEYGQGNQRIYPLIC